MKITVITICLNDKDRISRTIESVINQTYSDLEYIIIDGKSTDGTLDIIKNYQQFFPIRVLSEKDEGIYDAMNKGTDLATGDYINFMNSGDYYYNNEVLKKISVYLNNINDIIYGSTIFDYGSFQVLRKPRNIHDYWKKMPINHQSMFTKRTMLVAKPFNTSFTLAADYDFFLNSLFSNTVWFNCNETISCFNNQGASNKFQVTAIKEYKIILKKYNKLNVTRGLYYRLLLLKPFFKKHTPHRLIKIIYRYLVK